MVYARLRRQALPSLCQASDSECCRCVYCCSEETALLAAGRGAWAGATGLLVGSGANVHVRLSYGVFRFSIKQSG